MASRISVVRVANRTVRKIACWSIRRKRVLRCFQSTLGQLLSNRRGNQKGKESMSLFRSRSVLDHDSPLQQRGIGILGHGDVTFRLR